jgi:hypothetical protein
MFHQNKLIKLCFFVLIFLLGCVSSKNDSKVNNVETINDDLSKLKSLEWFNFVDSVSTYSDYKEYSIDSVSLFFMRKNTPEIIAKPKYVFWLNNRIKSTGDFDFFIHVSNADILSALFNRRNIIINRIKIGSDTLLETAKLFFDLENEKEFFDPCNQISNVNVTQTNQEFIFKIEIFQSCFDKYYYKELMYPIN